MLASFVARRPAVSGRSANEGTWIMVKKLVLALIATGIVMGATACNTVRGAGEDVESAANAVDKAT
jgi:entericidin B